jgi:hypothetical protein
LTNVSGTIAFAIFRVNIDIHIHAEGGNCSVFRNVGQLPTFDGYYTIKPKFYIEITKFLIIHLRVSEDLLELPALYTALFLHVLVAEVNLESMSTWLLQLEALYWLDI